MPNLTLKPKPDQQPLYDIFDMTDEGPVIDLGVDLEYYSGPIYVKIKDAKAIGASVGMVSEEEFNAVVNERDELLKLNQELRKEIEERNAGLDARIAGILDDYLSRFVSKGEARKVSGVSEVNGPSSKSSGEKSEGARKTAKSSDSEKSDGVSTDRSNVEFDFSELA